MLYAQHQFQHCKGEGHLPAMLLVDNRELMTMLFDEVEAEATQTPLMTSHYQVLLVQHW